MSRLKEIQDYFVAKNKIYSEEEFSDLIHRSGTLSFIISRYVCGGRSQKSDGHLLDALEAHKRFEHYIESDDIDELYEKGIPVYGVGEVIYLLDSLKYDVFTINDLKEIYEECDFKNYFKLYIEPALNALVPIDGEEILDYCSRILKNDIAAFAKYMIISVELEIMRYKDFDLDTCNYLKDELLIGFLLNSILKINDKLNMCLEDLNNKE